GQPGRAVARRLQQQPFPYHAADLLQPSGDVVPDARGTDRLPRSIQGAGCLDRPDRSIQCPGTSPALAGQPSGRSLPDTRRAVGEGAVTPHCLQLRPEKSFGASYLAAHAAYYAALSDEQELDSQELDYQEELIKDLLGDLP